MVNISGGYTPGSAWGAHSGFGDIGTAGGGGGGLSGMWGFLKRQQDMRDRMAEAQLALIAEQIESSRQGRQQDLDRAGLEEWLAKRQESEWKRQAAYEAAEQTGAGQAMAKALMQSGFGYGSEGALAGMIGAIGPERAHEGLMQSGRILASLSQQAPAGEPLPEEVGGRPLIGASELPSPEQRGAMPSGTTFGQEGPYPGIPPTVGPGPRPNTTYTNAPMGAGDVMVGPQAPMMPNIGGTIRPYLTPGLQPRRSGVSGWSHEKGTLPGTVQETGPAIVHEKEVIIPAEQVDQPLLAYLRRDAMRKGVPLGQGTPTEGYGCGTLKYAEGSLGQGGGWGEFYRVLGEAKEEAARAEAAKRGIRGMQVSPKVVPRPKAPTAAAPWSAYGGPGGMGKSAMAKVAKKELGDDAIKALGKTKKGKALLASLGIAGGVAVAAADVEPLDWKEMMMFALNPPVAIGHAAMQNMMGAGLKGEELPGVGPALGTAAREQVGGMGAAYAPTVGGFLRGLVPGLGEGPPPEAEGLSVEGTPLELATGIEESAAAAAPAGPPAGSLDVALARTGAGDFGTPEAPLELRGEAEPAYPKSYEDLRALPENITARHKAEMNQVQAERLLDHLQFHGHAMAPEQYQMVMDQAKQKMTLGQMYGKQTQDREKFMQQTAMVGAELQKKLQEIVTREETKGMEQRTTQQQKYDRLERLSTIRQGAMQLRSIIDSALTDTSASRRSDNMALIAKLLQEAAEYSGDAKLDERSALERAEMIVNAPKEQQEFAIITLQDILQQMVR